MSNDQTLPAVPRDAATLMLLREGAGGLEVFLARRSSESRFMPGAYVFPGGAVDASDREPEVVASALGANAAGRVEAAFVIAALRETFEEANVLLAARADGTALKLSADAREELRRAADARENIAPVLRAHGGVYDARGVVHYSNWVTPPQEPLRFDTHFFAALAPEGETAASDAYELHDGRWMAAAQALAAAASGRLSIMFPTLKHLERIAQFGDAASFLAHARSRTVARIAPSLAARAGGIDVLMETDSW